MRTRREWLRQAALISGGVALMGARALRGQAAEDDADEKLIAGSRSLKARAQKHGLLAGCAVAASPLQSDETYRRVLAQQYDLVVAENCMKFGSLRPTPEHYNFEDADALVAFAEQHGMQVRGHNFVWHLAIPGWFAGTVTKDNASNVMAEHILTVGGRYKGKIQSWDVVNEAINVSDGRPDRLRKSPWLELIGPEYLEIAYRTARQADPHAKLTYNDYDLEYDTDGQDKKRAAVLALLRRLKDQGVPLDALGIQSHIGTVSKAKFGKGLRELISAAQGMGLEVYITEMDVNDDSLEDDDPAVRDREVAKVYKDYLHRVLESKATKAVLTWGFTDRYTWLNEFEHDTKKHPDRKERSLPFDADLKPTPAFFAIGEAFDHATPGTGNPQVINPTTGVVTSAASSGFGKITSANTMRQIQLGARLTF